MNSLSPIYAKTLSRIPTFAQLSERTLYRRMEQIRDFVNKSRSQPLTVQDLAEYVGCDPDQILSSMKN